MLRLVRAGFIDTDVLGLFVRQFSDLGTNAIEVQASHFLIEMLRQHVDLALVVFAVLPQLDLRQTPGW